MAEYYAITKDGHLQRDVKTGQLEIYENEEYCKKRNRSGMSVDQVSVNKPIDGLPCSHAGCLSHVSHACEGCGRIRGKGADSDDTIGKRIARHIVERWEVAPHKGWADCGPMFIAPDDIGGYFDQLAKDIDGYLASETATGINGEKV